MISQVPPSNLIIPGLTDKRTWRAPLSSLLANPRTVTLVPTSLVLTQQAGLCQMLCRSKLPSCWDDWITPEPDLWSCAPLYWKQTKQERNQTFPRGVSHYWALYLKRNEKVMMFYIWMNLMEDQTSLNCFPKFLNNGKVNPHGRKKKKKLSLHLAINWIESLQSETSLQFCAFLGVSSFDNVQPWFLVSILNRGWMNPIFPVCCF